MALEGPSQHYTLGALRGIKFTRHMVSCALLGGCGSIGSIINEHYGMLFIQYSIIASLACSGSFS